MDEWIVPVMQGTLQIEPCNIEGYAFDFVLISRRSRERAGNPIFFYILLTSLTL